MKNIIFVAPPAAGKGTQSDILVKKFNYDHISTGDMLREEIASGSALGMSVKNIIDNGGLVTDDIMINLIKNRLNKLEGRPFILDGFPRTLIQAETLHDILTDDYQVIYLELSEEIARRRILGRITCACGRSYNLYDDDLKPQNEGVCDECGAKLIKRNDDNEESFNNRYRVFIENTKPIIDYYNKLNKLIIIDASKDVNTITELVTKAIEK